MGGLRVRSLNKLHEEVLSVNDLDCSRGGKGESSRRWSQLVRRLDSVGPFRPF